MKYAKYILIMLALFFGVKFRYDYSNTEMEIRSIEEAYKSELESKLKEYYLNSENTTFHFDSVSLSIEQKYLALLHRIEIQYLHGDFDKKMYYEKLQELSESESKENSDNLESLPESKENPIPKTPIPELLIESRKSLGEYYRLSFILGGVMTFFFLLGDVLTWLKDRPQLKYPIRVNPPRSPLDKLNNNQIVYDGKTLTRTKVQLDDCEINYKWIDVNNNPAEVPAATTAKWDMVHDWTDTNIMIRDGRTLTRMKEGEREYEGGEFWMDEDTQTPYEVPIEEVIAWEKSKIS